MSETLFLALLFLAAALILVGVVILWLFARKHGAQPPPDEVEYPTPDFTTPAGFAVTGLPSDEIIQLKSSSLKKGRLGELNFLIEPGWSAVLRVARTGTDLELGDFAQKYDSRSLKEIDGTKVVFRQNPGREALITWSKSGFDYALYYPEVEQGLAAGLLDDFVNEIVTETTVR